MTKNLHFITSISKEYWEDTAKYCIPTWNLPGKITIYIDQRNGDLRWIQDLPHNVEALRVPDLKIDEDFVDRRKVLKFWGKTCAQLQAIRDRGNQERIIWIDADVEQTNAVPDDLFSFSFKEPVAMMNSQDGDDKWETGIVIFNQENEKLGQFAKKYEKAWRDDEILNSLWKPYDAQVLGYVAEDRTYLNLCDRPCRNIDALENSRFGLYFKHWINKDNKSILKEKNESKDNSSLS